MRELFQVLLWGGLSFAVLAYAFDWLFHLPDRRRSKVK
jgi:hypothetical protein